MKARLALPIAVAVVTLAAWVRADNAKYQLRLDGLNAKARDERKKKGLERDAAKLFAAYPTPELKLTALDACPGATLTVKATGKFPEGTAFVFQSDQVEVLSEKAAPTSYEAEVRVKPNTLPQGVSLVSVSPVSNAQRSVVAINVGCKQVWTVKLDTGETLTVRTAWPKGAAATAKGPGEWLAGSKATKSDFEVTGSAGDFVLRRSVPADELNARVRKLQDAMKSPEQKKLMDRQNIAITKLQECAKLVNDMTRMQACMQPVNAEMTAISEAQQALQKGAASKPAVGCETLRVEVDAAGALTGTGDECFDLQSHALTGTVKAEG